MKWGFIVLAGLTVLGDIFIQDQMASLRLNVFYGVFLILFAIYDVADMFKPRVK